MYEILCGAAKTVLALGLCAAFLAAGSPAAVAGSEARCPNDKTKFARVDVTIADGEISVSPESQKIYLDKEPKRICWVVSNLGENRTLRIKRKDPSDKAMSNRKIKSPKNFANSGFPGGGLDLEPGEQHSWGYALEVTVTGQSDPIMTLDPEVIIVRRPTGGK